MQHFLCPHPVKVLIKILEEIQLLSHLHAFAKIGSVRKIGYQCLGFGAYGLVINGNTAPIGCQQPRHQLDKGGFSTAIGT